MSRAHERAWEGWDTAGKLREDGVEGFGAGNAWTGAHMAG